MLQNSLKVVVHREHEKHYPDGTALKKHNNIKAADKNELLLLTESTQYTWLHQTNKPIQHKFGHHQCLLLALLQSTTEICHLGFCLENRNRLRRIPRPEPHPLGLLNPQLAALEPHPRYCRMHPSLWPE